MKYILRILLFLSIHYLNLSMIHAQEIDEGIISKTHEITQRLKLKNSSIINELDTVIFDLSQAVFTGDIVEAPVSISSNDSVYALDFSFKFNHTRLVYDSIIDIANYFQSLSYYNPSDSTVRYTSNSFQKYSNDTALVIIRFRMLSGNIKSTDLTDLNVYLNGAPCSVKVINPLPTGLSKMNTLNYTMIYPNPASEILYIELNEKARVEIFDLNNKPIFQINNVDPYQKTGINTGSFATGIYFLKISNKNNLLTKKIEIIN